MMSESLFEIPAARQDVHACTGPGCHFCEWVDGHQAKAKGTQAVNYDPRWLHEATEWRRGQIGQEITADDLIEAIGLPDGHPNQIGALFRKWAGMGLARQTGLIQSRRNSNHARRVIIWEVTA